MASKPVQQTTRDGRFYVLEDGTRLPSVTTVLSSIGKPALVTWAANLERELVMEAAADLNEDMKALTAMSRPSYLSTLGRRLGDIKAHHRESEKACDIGSAAHAAVEHTLKTALGLTVSPAPRLGPEAACAYAAFQAWAKEHDVRPIRVEDRVWSRRYGYAGTTDLLAEVDGVLTLVDFKTSKAIYAESTLQVAAYVKALEEMGHERAARGMIVRIPKTADSTFEVLEVPDLDAAFGVFLHVVELFTWWHAEDLKSKAAWQARRSQAVA